jgi:rod shape determining protein RodA
MADYAAPLAPRVRRRRAEAAGLVGVLRRLDWILFGALAAVVLYGLWAIDGITKHDVPGDPEYYVVRQAIFAVFGAVAMAAVVFVDPDYYRRYRKAVYAVALSLLLIVMATGADIRGSTRWIDFGFFRFQPSEFVKLLLALVLAGALTGRARQIGDWRTTGVAVGLAAVPTLLVFTQPDIGTALVYGAILLAALFFAGTRWRDLGVLALIAGLLGATVLWFAPSVGIEILEPYQQQRLGAFLNPSENPQGAAYNINQSITAVGSGGSTGRGVAGATQTNLDYLPEHHTDFVFASLAEQRGFLGAAVLLLLYLLLIWRGIRVIATARDAFCATAAGAIVFAFLFQVFVNVGMTIGIAPITGIPLPFVSVGGSSMVTNLLAVGVLQAIALRRR